MKIPRPRTGGGMTFRDHERIMFEAQRAEARGEFRDMVGPVPALDRSVKLSRPDEHEVRGGGGRQMRIRLTETVVEPPVETQEDGVDG